MPIFLSKTVFDDSKLGVWSIEEDEQYFKQALQLSDQEASFVDKIKGRRKEEWLSSRHLVHLMSKRNKRAEILKDEFGKPYIHDSDHHISFSHSHGMSAAIASLKLVGIDIQYIVPKITRIAPRFMNVEETARLKAMHSSKHLELMHIIWGAKESLFKAYGKKSVDFKKHMNVIIEDWEGEYLSFWGQFKKDDFQSDFKIVAEKLENYILVYAEQI